MYVQNRPTVAHNVPKTYPLRKLLNLFSVPLCPTTLYIHVIKVYPLPPPRGGPPPYCIGFRKQPF
jgi:hypothetical protein